MLGGGAKSRLLAFLLILILLSSSLSAACGSAWKDSGDCSGNAIPVLASINDPDCCAWMGGVWSVGCAPGTGSTPSVTCTDHKDNALACQSAGCTWSAKCGGVSPGTGQCSGFASVSYPSINDQGCCTWLKGVWNFGCSASGTSTLPSIVCTDLSDNEPACNAAGCTWMAVCGSITKNSGRCTSVTAGIDFAKISDPDCCSFVGGSWNFGCTPSSTGTLPNIGCNYFDNNQPGCDAIGCTWVKPCGSVIPNSGKCTSLTAGVDFTKISDKDCCVFFGGSWSLLGACTPSSGGSLPNVGCTDFDSNPVGCAAMGCTWVPCKKTQEQCADGSECCDGNCNAGHCGCGGTGTQCTVNGNCCSGKCTGGKCDCAPDTAGCSENTDCCTGLCNTNKRCGCWKDTVQCSKDSECCGNFCNQNTQQCGCGGIATKCTSSSDCCSGFCGCKGFCEAGAAEKDWTSGIVEWIALAVIVSAVLIALAYMTAKVLELQVLEAWVKIEMSELVASVVIALFCIALIASVNAAARFLSGECAQADAMAAANGFIINKWYEDGRIIYMKLADAYFNSAKISSYSWTAGSSVGVASASTSETPAGGLSGLVAQEGQGMDTVANFMLLAATQSAFLLFFQAAAVIMLPAGIFLRTFVFTRKIGGVVLAAVIASAVIYPASTLLAGEIYGNFEPDMMDNYAAKIQTSSPGNPPSVDMVCSPFMKAIVDSPVPFIGGGTGWKVVLCLPFGLQTWCPPCQVYYQFCNRLVPYLFMTVKSLYPLIAWESMLKPYIYDQASTPELLEGHYDPIAKYALPAVAMYSVLSLVNFLVPLIISVVMLRNLATAFGGEPQLYGLSKLV